MRTRGPRAAATCTAAAAALPLSPTWSAASPASPASPADSGGNETAQQLSDQPQQILLKAKCGHREVPRYDDNPYVGHWFEKRLPAA